MKIALIADLHANFTAFQAVLSDLKRARPDLIICLGDVAETGPQPREVISRLRELGDPVVMGNTDAQMLQPIETEEEVDEDRKRMEDIFRWCVEQLGEDDLNYLRTFQPHVEVDMGQGVRLVCYHGSPRSNKERIEMSTPEDALAEMLAGHDATIFAGGHTHQVMLRSYASSLVINPGSVGLPFVYEDGMVRNPSWAEYALVTNNTVRTHHGAGVGELRVDFRRTPVNLEALKAAVRTSGMPHADWWLRDWS
jgi:putative phosphoesterase